MVKSRMGAVAWAMRQHSVSIAAIEPDVPISGIRLSDWFHREPLSGAVRGRRSRRSRPRSP